MNSLLFEPTIIGVCVGILFGTAYLIVCFSRKVAPNFNQFAVIVLSCVGAMVSIQFGYIVLKTPKEQLGPFQDQRLPMSLGALAIIWISVEAIIKIYLPLIKREAQNADLEETKIEDQRKDISH